MFFNQLRRQSISLGLQGKARSEMAEATSIGAADGGEFGAKVGTWLFYPHATEAAIVHIHDVIDGTGIRQQERIAAFTLGRHWEDSAEPIAGQIKHAQLGIGMFAQFEFNLKNFGQDKYIGVTVITTFERADALGTAIAIDHGFQPLLAPFFQSELFELVAVQVSLIALQMQCDRHQGRTIARVE